MKREKEGARGAIALPPAQPRNVIAYAYVFFVWPATLRESMIMGFCAPKDCIR
jgi:hypothetical protein